MPADRDPLIGQDELARMLESHEGPVSGRTRPPAPRRRRPSPHWTGAVAVGALLVGSGVGFGLGTSVTERGNAASGARGLGFLPASGWTVLQSGEDAARLPSALAIASNIPFHPEDDARGVRRSSGLPYATLLDLPRNGIVMVATFTVPNEDTPDDGFPSMSLPLKLRDATPFVQNGAQIRPERPLGVYQLRARVEGRDVYLDFYFGTPEPSDAAIAAAQRQLDLLVVERAPTRGEQEQRAIPESVRAPSSPVGPVATVIDRTLTCRTGFGKGTQNVELIALSGFRSGGRLDQFGQVVVATPGNPVPSNRQTFAPTLVGVTAGWPPPPQFASGGMGFSPKLCKPTRVRVAFSQRGLGVGGDASVFGEDLTCVTPRSVVIRVRAAFFGAAKLVPNEKKDYLSADARIKKAQIAVRTPSGKAIAYGEVFDSGKARLFTARSCV